MFHKHLIRILPAMLAAFACTGCSKPETSQTEETGITTTVSSAAPDEQSDHSAVTTRFQGGIGGEKNAQTPLPENFTYRFQPNGISVRLAGGTYQALEFDFVKSGADMQSIQKEYYLDDYDGDGCYDLYIPAEFGQNQVTKYAVFIWDSAAKQFNPEPSFAMFAENSENPEDDSHE